MFAFLGCNLGNFPPSIFQFASFSLSYVCVLLDSSIKFFISIISSL